MPAIKDMVVKNMCKVTVFLTLFILFLSTFVQISDQQNQIQQNARKLFSQVDQILDENSKELEQLQQEYAASCLNNARTAAYILEHNPEAKDDSEELQKIAANIEVDEIHIFDANGVIVAGTHPEYFGYSFDSGKQLKFFKPLLTDKYMEMVQDIMPNTTKGNLVQYSALWSENKEFIIQIGMYPDKVLQVTEKNKLSHIFSLFRTEAGYCLYAVNPDTEKVVEATNASDVDQNISSIGFQMEQLTSGDTFYAKVDQNRSYCFSKRIGENYIVWTMPVSDFYQTIFTNDLLLLAGLILISAFLIYTVTKS